MKRLSSIVAATAALAMTGCGLTASPTDGIAFTPPKGWTSSPGIAGFMQFWRSPRDGEVLMLFRSPKPITTSDAFQSANLRDATIESRKDVTICDGRQRAQEYELRGRAESGGNAHDVDATTVMSTAGGATYFTVYVRRVDMSPNPDAVAAVHELCPKT